MIIYVCKICGRAIKSNVPPTCCYFDNCHSLENISNEDAVKMGLFELSKGFTAIFSDGPNWAVIFEFPGDYKYHPFTGEQAPAVLSRGKLTDFQDQIMRKVINNE